MLLTLFTSIRVEEIEAVMAAGLKEETVVIPKLECKAKK